MSQSSEKHGKLQLRIKSLMHFATRHPLSFLCLAAHKPACFFANKWQISHQTDCPGVTQLEPCAASPKLSVFSTCNLLAMFSGNSIMPIPIHWAQQ